MRTLPTSGPASSLRAQHAKFFDRRTIKASLVLAQIVKEEQPTTVRSAFYRAVSAGVYPNTAEAHYRQALRVILKLRRSGLVPYSYVVDSLRTREKPSSWSGLEDFGESVRACYRKDFWAGQSDYVEVVVEKDAMAGVLSPATEEFDIHLNVIRGNCSESHLWKWAEFLNDVEKPIHIYYLGDHDPNGLGIEEDLQDRLQGFLNRNKSITWKRLAIDAQDFEREDLLGFPTRRSQSKAWNGRCNSYVARHGDRCVEVDAIPSNEIRQRVREAIALHIDAGAWARLRAVEELEKETINKVFGGGGAQ